MDQSVKPQISNNGFNFFTTTNLSLLLSKFFIFVGLASLLVAFFGLGRNILLVQDMDSFTIWDSYYSILFYFPAGVMILIANVLYKKFPIQNWFLGALIGFTVYVSLHLLADLADEVEILGFLGLGVPLFMPSQVGIMLWDLLDKYLIRRFGNYRYWIELLGISWFSATPFVVIGIMYAQKSRWIFYLAVILSAFYLFLCLVTLYALWLMLLPSIL